MVFAARSPSSIRLTAPRSSSASCHRSFSPSSIREGSAAGKSARNTLSGSEASRVRISCQISSAVKLRIGASIRVRAESTSHIAVRALRRPRESAPST